MSTTEAKPTSPVAETAPASSTPDASTGAAGDVSDTTAAVAPADVGTGGAEGTQNEEADTSAEAGGAGVEIDVNAQLTVRALVSTKEAGVIIGKGGANVAELREKTGVKAGVSKVVPGVHDRVLSVTGTIDGVSRAYSHIANTILDNPAPAPTAPGEAAQPGPFTSVRLLISHNLMGTVIGRQGLKIKHIQDVSGARMVASKEMLPQSTERIVEVQGTTESIRVAVLEIAKCLLEDWERGQGTVQYQPGQVEGAGVLAAAGAAGPLQGGAQPGQGGGPRRPSAPYLGGAMNAMTLAGGPGAPAASGSGAARRSSPQVEGGAANGAPRRAPAAAADAAALAAGAAVTPGGGLVPGASAASLGGATLDAAANQRTQNISIPSDMVGCIIGKGGSKITEIRRLSGSRISIAKVPHDDTGERMFTIQGTPEANEKALFLLYNQLESEKERRTSTAHEEGSAEATAAAAAASAASAASPAAPAGGDEVVAA